MTERIRVDPDHPDPALIARAAACLRAGGLVAFPTETVYGLGAHALDPVAVRRIFAAKGRPSTDPLIVHVASADLLPSLASVVPEEARMLAARFWPGPLTLVLPRAPEVPDEVTAGLGTVAVRVPAHPVAQALLVAAGVPVAAPSANLFSRPSPTTADHVIEDLDGRVDLVLDGGPTTVGIESTVLDLSQTPPVVLRPGAVTLDMLRQVVSDVTLGGGARDTGEPLPSPGLLARHYSPRAALTLYEGPTGDVLDTLVEEARRMAEEGGRVGVVLADEDRGRIEPAVAGQPIACRYLGRSDDLTTVAVGLYATLRALDAAGVDVMLVRGFPATSGLGIAIQDRLRRAAAGRVVRCGAQSAQPGA